MPTTRTATARPTSVKKLFSGFATHNYQARVNSLQFGLDNWVYASTGLFGGQITAFTGDEIDITSRDFRIQPDTGEIEPVTGQTQQSRVRDDWGNWFGCDNGTLSGTTRWSITTSAAIRTSPRRHGASNVADYPNSNRLFPIAPLVTFKLSGPPGPVGNWRLAAWESIATSCSARQFAGNAFTCEPVNQVVHRLVLVAERRDAFAVDEPRTSSNRNSSASTDNWFRPVQAAHRPRRCAVGRRHVSLRDRASDLDSAGSGGHARRPRRRHARGASIACFPRIARRDRSPGSTSSTRPDWSPRSTRRTDRSATWRSRCSSSPATARPSPLLEQLVPQEHDRRRGCTRLCAPRRTQRAGCEAGRATLGDEHPGVRRHAIRLAEAVRQQADRLGRDAPRDDRRRRRPSPPPVGVFTRRVLRERTRATALATLAIAHADDEYLVAAAMSSLRPDNVRPFARRLLSLSASRDTSEPPAKLLSTLLDMDVAAGDRELWSEMLQAAATAAAQPPRDWQFAVLARLLIARQRCATISNRSPRMTNATSTV